MYKSYNKSKVLRFMNQILVAMTWYQRDLESQLNCCELEIDMEQVIAKQSILNTDRATIKRYSMRTDENDELHSMSDSSRAQIKEICEFYLSMTKYVSQVTCSFPDPEPEKIYGGLWPINNS